MVQLKVRIATPEDRDAIELLTRFLVGERKEEFDSKRFEWGLLRRLYDPIQRHGIFVAEATDDDELITIVGMIFSELRVDPFGYSEGYIKQFYVRPDFRRQGIGKELLNAAISHMKKMGVQVIKVNVKPDANEAFRMYSQKDFRTKYHVMELNLKEKEE